MADQHRDNHVYSRALYLALGNDPFYAILENSVADRSISTQAMLAYYDYSILEADHYGLVFRPDHEPAGLSLWSLPLSRTESARKAEQKKSAILAAMGEACLQTYLDITGFMAVSAQPLVSDRDWYLSIVGILPEYQGQGLGESLVRPVLVRADRAGVATYLETFTSRNMSFYRRLGYNEAGSFVEPVTGSRYWLMTRPPRR